MSDGDDDDALLWRDERTCYHFALSTVIRKTKVSKDSVLKSSRNTIARFSRRSHVQRLRPATTCVMRRRKATYVDNGFLDHICGRVLASTPRTHREQAEAYATKWWTEVIANTLIGRMLRACGGGCFRLWCCCLLWRHFEL